MRSVPVFVGRGLQVNDASTDVDGVLFLTPLANPPTIEATLDERVSQLVRRRRKATPARGFDDRDWPLVVVTVGASDGDQQLADLLDCVSAAHLRGPFALVVDIPAAFTLTVERRRLIATARAVDEKFFPGVLCARAVVVADATCRRAMLAVAWLRPTLHPVQLFSKRQDATLWACSRIAERSHTSATADT